MPHRTEIYNYGLIGLATMGENLARNLASHNISIAVYNRTTSTMEKFVALCHDQYQLSSSMLAGFGTIKELVAALERPRKIILLVKAGEAVDDMIEKLTPLLAPEDIIIDSGNSYYLDTIRRYQELKSQNINYVGMGVSGGAAGALHGPSLMPGGDQAVVAELLPALQLVAARDFAGDAAVSYIGPTGAGHFVKMVHNGIEYALMQAIAEIYDHLRDSGQSNQQIAELFEQWNATDLSSYLLEITIDILRTRDKESGEDLVDRILDKAENKGTGKWTVQAGLDLGVSVPTLAEALFARYTSSQKELRLKLASGYRPEPKGEQTFVHSLPKMLYQHLKFTSLISYYQGMELIRVASKEYNWQIDLAEVCRIWQGGCIIRSQLLKHLHLVYSEGNEPLSTQYFREQLKFTPASFANWRTSAPVITSAHQFLRGLTQANSPANLLQAQRDYFGQHTYQRVDRAGKFTGPWGESS